MHDATNRRLMIAWLVLSAVTLISFAVAPPAAHAALPDAGVTIGVIAVSLIKVRIVLREFMEVRHTPPILTRLTDLWLLVTGVLLVGAYLAGSPLLR